MTEPFLVRLEHWQVVDGRHRVAASFMAGCADILAVLDQ